MTSPGVASTQSAKRRRTPSFVLHSEVPGTKAKHSSRSRVSLDRHSPVRSHDAARRGEHPVREEAQDAELRPALGGPRDEGEALVEEPRLARPPLARPIS